MGIAQNLIKKAISLFSVGTQISVITNNQLNIDTMQPLDFKGVRCFLGSEFN